MMSSRRSSVRRIGRVGTGLFLAAFAGVLVLPAALGQSGSPSVSADPSSELVNQQYVDVAIAGQRPGYVMRIRECPSGATDVAQCKGDSANLRDPGDARLVTAKQDGSGSTSFLILAGAVKDANGSTFMCDHAHPCELVAFQTDDFGNDIGFDHASRTIVNFGASTVACPEGDRKSRISGSGATAPAADIVEWESEVCGDPYKLNVSYAITNSPNGKLAFINGVTDSDFAISTVPLKASELDQLKQANRDVLQIPIAVGSLAFVYNYDEVVNRCNGNQLKTHITNLRLSAPTIIGILTGHITDMNDDRIARDNPELVGQFRSSNCDPVSALPSRLIQSVGRADNSGATWTLSSWAIANAKDAWEANGPGFRGGATEIFPAGNGVDLRTGNAAVARDVRTAGGTTDGPASSVWFGYVDSSVARQLGLPSVSVVTSAGSSVKPTNSAVKAALAAGTLEADGVVTPNYTPTDPNAYPLLSVSYLITDKARLTQARAATMKAFAAYTISGGQDAAELRGYVPLSSELKTSAAKQVDQITFDPNATDETTGGHKKKRRHTPSGSSPLGLPTLEGNRGDRSSGHRGTDAADPTMDLASSLLGSVDGSGADLTPQQLAAISPIKGGPVATQTLGPAGGPAGIVRALTVFLGVPVLLVLGLLCLLVGSLDKIVVFVRSRVSLRERRLSWRAI